MSDEKKVPKGIWISGSAIAAIVAGIGIAERNGISLRPNGPIVETAQVAQLNGHDKRIRANERELDRRKAVIEGAVEQGKENAEKIDEVQETTTYNSTLLKVIYEATTKTKAPEQDE
jgi:hypothetical protein